MAITLRCSQSSTEILSTLGRFEAVMDQMIQRAYRPSAPLPPDLGAGREGSAADPQILGTAAATVQDVNGEYLIEVSLPGFAPSEIEVTAAPSDLVVEATKQAHRATPLTVFQAMQFPEPVNPDGMKCSLRRGILEIRAPKSRCRALEAVR